MYIYIKTINIRSPIVNYSLTLMKIPFLTLVKFSHKNSTLIKEGRSTNLWKKIVVKPRDIVEFLCQAAAFDVKHELCSTNPKCFN